MIQVKLEHIGIDNATISNEELIKGILAMPEDEYSFVSRGILHRKKLNTDKLMGIFAYIGNELKKSELLPPQKEALKSYLNEFIKLI